MSIGYADGYIGEGTMGCAGPGAVERARLPGQIVRERLDLTGGNCRELRFDLMGVDSLHRDISSVSCVPYEVILRAAGKCNTLAQAAKIGREVEALYTNGP